MSKKVRFILVYLFLLVLVSYFGIALIGSNHEFFGGLILLGPLFMILAPLCIFIFNWCDKGFTNNK